MVSEDAGVSNEPDVSFASWQTLQSGRLAPPAAKGDRSVELVGTPDWDCDVLSDSSVEKDAVLLRDAYDRAGIPEYWMVDARGEAVDVTLLTATPSGQEETPADADGWRRSPVFAREFRLTRSRDRGNRWRYRLAHRVS